MVYREFKDCGLDCSSITFPRFSGKFISDLVLIEVLNPDISEIPQGEVSLIFSEYRNPPNKFNFSNNYRLQLTMRPEMDSGGARKGEDDLRVQKV